MLTIFTSCEIHWQEKEFMILWPSVIVSWILVSGIHPNASEWTPLFNGNDLDGWQKYLGIPNAESLVPTLTTNVEGNYISDLGVENDPLKVFTIVTHEGEAAIRVSGEIFGTLNSTKSYSNYHLKLEYKWGEKKWPPRKDLPRDSGLLYHGFGEPGCVGMRWHHTQECQIQQGDCGDYWPVGDVEIDIPSSKPDTGRWYGYNKDAGLNTFIFAKDLTKRRCIKSGDYELPHDRWNTVELICWGDSSIHVVNGKVVMRLYNSVQIKRGLRRPLTSGIIALQSEGAEIFYRNINIRPISEIPQEYADLE